MEFGDIQVLNAKIKFSYLGIEDNKLCYQLGFEIQGGTSITTNKYYVHNTVFIEQILNVLEVRSWEELPRKFARIQVDTSNNGKKIIAIGNLIENKWVRYGQE